MGLRDGAVSWTRLPVTRNALLTRVTRDCKRDIMRATRPRPSEETSLDPQSTTAFISLRDKVVRRVRSDIVSGRSAPGTMYSVPALAEQLAISTTPVREALLELSRSGLISPRRNRGFLVEAISLDDLNNLFAVRTVLERFASVTLAERGLNDTAELRDRADAIAAAVRAKDVLGYLEADRAFHLALVERADNPLLTKLVMELRDGMRLYGSDSTAGRQRQVASVKEHYRLIELAVARDTTEIAALIDRHINDWKPVFTAALAQARSGLGANRVS
jgi:DNA-binding GntR family transcriptional regulator